MICDNCSNYVFDEDSQEYFCDALLDEDEMQRFLTGDNKTCPYFRLDDEYAIVRKQN